jgi:hypothetical protein
LRRPENLSRGRRPDLTPLRAEYLACGIAGQNDASATLILSQQPIPRNEIAGRESPGRRIEEAEMANHLYFLLVTVVVLGLRVKVTIDRK